MKNAIIIGASSGIGYELAIQMANQGYRLGLMARRQELLVELSDRLPGEHFVQVTDLLDADMARTQLATLIEKMGDVELIVVNSGVGASEKILDWTIESEMIDVNVRGFTAMSMDAMNHFVHFRKVYQKWNEIAGIGAAVLGRVGFHRGDQRQV